MTQRGGCSTAGAAIVDVGGESTRPGSQGVTADEELERIEQVLLDLAGAPRFGRHLEGGGRAACARAGRRARQRRDGAPRRPRARGGRRGRGMLSLPHAHAGRAAHDAGRPHLRRRRLGREAVSRGAARVRGRRRACGRSSSASTQGSASGRRLRTTSSSCAGSTSSRDRAAAARSGFRARARLGKITGDPDATVASAAASVGGAVARSIAARRSCACTTCVSTSRRSRSRKRWPRMIVELRGIAGVRLPRCRGGGEAARAALSVRRAARGRRPWCVGPARRTRSTTRRSRVRSASSPNAQRFDLLEALAGRTADLLMERFSPESRARPCAQAAGRAGRD